MKFNHYTLDQLVAIKYGKNQKKVLSDEGTIPIYGTGGLMGYATESLYDKPSVLIGRKGTIGKVKYVNHPFWTVDTLFYTVVNEEIVIPKYLYYVMSQIDLNKYNEGTTIPSLRTETLNRIEFDIPSIANQKEILSYLLPIEEKIVINTKINDNLSEQRAGQAGQRSSRMVVPARTRRAGVLHGTIRRLPDSERAKSSNLTCRPGLEVNVGNIKFTRH